jgi:putative ABC transport system substrate-binding protein
MKAKILVYVLPALFLATIQIAEAQEKKKISWIGYLAGGGGSAPNQEFVQGMRALGYVEGKNMAFVYRPATREAQLPDLAEELVRHKVDVIVAAGTSSAIQAAQNATRTIPIVMMGIPDPVAWGFIASLDRPGGNITGLSHGGFELFGKRLELLKETVPRVSRVAFFWNTQFPAADLLLKETRAASQVLGLQIQSLEVRRPNDLEGAFKAAVKGSAGGLTVGASPMFSSNRNRILDFAAKNRLPGMYPWREYVEDGGLMSYAPNRPELNRRVAYYVDKILKGTKPADLPVEQPIKFELIINLKTAKQIGLTIPPEVLARATKIIR